MTPTARQRWVLATSGLAATFAFVDGTFANIDLPKILHVLSAIVGWT